ncbi:hypothetical protein KSP40_PGU009982 [Platanthera guangdongensis]|uniref:Uncharacterized protein n=1 Tax=Platanthera guangdongensis TaxID=2320717 RepID=A0ABR2ML81_9ASPA
MTPKRQGAQRSPWFALTPRQEWSPAEDAKVEGFFGRGFTGLCREGVLDVDLAREMEAIVGEFTCFQEVGKRDMECGLLTSNVRGGWNQTNGNKGVLIRLLGNSREGVPCVELTREMGNWDCSQSSQDRAGRVFCVGFDGMRWGLGVWVTGECFFIGFRAGGWSWEGDEAWLMGCWTVGFQAGERVENRCSGLLQLPERENVERQGDVDSGVFCGRCLEKRGGFNLSRVVTAGIRQLLQELVVVSGVIGVSLLRFGQTPPEGRASEWKVPTTFIYGYQDWMSYQGAQAAREGMKVPCDIIRVPEGGHFIFIDNPSGFHSAVFYACRRILAAWDLAAREEPFPEGLTSA